MSRAEFVIQDQKCGNKGLAPRSEGHLGDMLGVMIRCCIANFCVYAIRRRLGGSSACRAVHRHEIECRWWRLHCCLGAQQPKRLHGGHTGPLSCQ